MKIRNVTIILSAALVLGACQVKRVEEMSFTELKETAERIKARCRSQGVIEASKDWQPCLTQETSREMAVRNRVATALESSSGPIVCNRVGYTTICN